MRRQHHKKLGSVYAYRRELEGWWMGRTTLAGGAQNPGSSRQAIDVAEVEDSEFPRIILFPFEVVHLSGDRGPLQQIVGRFADGLNDELNLALSRSRIDPVCLSTGALPLHRASTPSCMREVAREFGSECYLAGTIQYAETVVRVSVQLIRSADSVCNWSQRFEASVDDLLRAQAEFARKIAQALQAQRLRRVAPSSRVHPIEHGPAYHACMLGLHFWKQRTRKDLLRALGYYQDAVLIDSTCADAYAGLADTYVALSYGHFIPAREATEGAGQAIAKALKLQPKSVNVQNAAINFNLTCLWNRKVAEQVCQEMVDSGRADARTLQLYASLMISLGEPEEAIGLALHAHRLDPLSDYVNSQVSFAYFYAGDYDSAISYAERTISLRPLFDTGHALLGRAQAQRGNWDKAIESFRLGLAYSGESPFLKALLAYGYAGRGEAPIARRILHEIEEQRGDACFPAVDVSAVHAMLNQENQALQNISRGYDLRDIKVTYIQYDPRFTRLRALPEFQRIASSFVVCSG